MSRYWLVLAIVGCTFYYVQLGAQENNYAQKYYALLKQQLQSTLDDGKIMIRYLKHLSSMHNEDEMELARKAAVRMTIRAIGLGTTIGVIMSGRMLVLQCLKRFQPFYTERDQSKSNVIKKEMVTSLQQRLIQLIQEVSTLEIQVNRLLNDIGKSNSQLNYSYRASIKRQANDDAQKLWQEARNNALHQKTTFTASIFKVSCEVTKTSNALEVILKELEKKQEIEGYAKMVQDYASAKVKLQKLDKTLLPLVSVTAKVFTGFSTM